MLINENRTRALRMVKEERGLSYVEFAEELGIPKSSLGEYLSGTGNPRADTLELLAEKCGVPMIELISDPPPEWGRVETIVRAAHEFSSLPPKQRERGVQLFLELAALFAGEYQK